MPEIDDPAGTPKQTAAKKMPKVPKQEACTHTKEGVDCPIHGKHSCPSVAEHCDMPYDAETHQCKHCNATGLHGEKECPECKGTGSLYNVNDGIKESAWQRKEGKNKSGGLNEKGRKSYERENPGSDLKAPSKKKGNKRRASFCARMKGMKKKLTSKKTASDPDSRINKSLRAWNC